MIDLERKCAREGGRITHMFANNVQYGQALKFVVEQSFYQMVTENARVAGNDRNPNGRAAQVRSGHPIPGYRRPGQGVPHFRCPSTSCLL